MQNEAACICIVLFPEVKNPRRGSKIKFAAVWYPKTGAIGSGKQLSKISYRLIPHPIQTSLLFSLKNVYIASYILYIVLISDGGLSRGSLSSVLKFLAK